VAALALGASASAGYVEYANDAAWGAGEGYASAFSSSWSLTHMHKNATFDTTITFIDNTSYSWHNTRRSTDTWLQTAWPSSSVKKAHCRSNVARTIWAGCAVYS
jgi:hypothetical protein